MSPDFESAAERSGAIQPYTGWVPPCGVFCGGCPVYRREKRGCPGAEVRCRERRCKGIYVCCVEKRGLRFCHECPSYPCATFRRFAERWLQYGQCLRENQERLSVLGPDGWRDAWNARAAGEPARPAGEDEPGGA